jgi:hypothetical protein
MKWGVAIVLLAGSSAAYAQDASRADVFAGYSMLASENCADCPPSSDRGTLHGGHVALGWGLSGRLGLLLDASGHQGTSGTGTDIFVGSLMAGPRATLGDGRLRPFVHVIGGIVRSKASVGVFEVEISETSTDFGGAAGGGLDWAFGERWAARLAGDYRVVKVEGETASDPRFSVGVVHRFRAR